ncbi:MAG: hypothetical protein ACPLRO_08790, partial [Candidatus Kapaibacteriota bacterium]
MKQKIWITLTFAFITIFSIFGKDENPFFFDAICFKSINSDTLSRIDVFVVVPYTTLSFFRTENLYYAEYTTTFTLKDSNNITLQSKSLTKKIEEKEQLETLGSSGKFQDSYYSFEIPEGKYVVEVSIFDRNSNLTFSKRRTTNALNFAKFDFAFSGIMFLSDVEEQNSEYKITPYLSDNLGDLENIFIFLETYQHSKKYDSID